MTTRANSAADTASTNIETPQAEPATRPPLLLRLEHGVRFASDNTQTLQPRIGASVRVGHDKPKGPKSVWLSADAWTGLGTIIRQTPDWHRAHVAEFLKVLDSSIAPTSAAVAYLLDEVIAELENDPYTDVTEDTSDEFDYAW